MNIAAITPQDILSMKPCSTYTLEFVEPLREKVLTRCITNHALGCEIPEVEQWAAKWLSGEDRSQAAAEAAAEAAWAATWAAAEAVAWAVVVAEAVAEAEGEGV